MGSFTALFSVGGVTFVGDHVARGVPLVCQAGAMHERLNVCCILKTNQAALRSRGVRMAVQRLVLQLHSTEYEHPNDLHACCAHPMDTQDHNMWHKAWQGAHAGMSGHRPLAT